MSLTVYKFLEFFIKQIFSYIYSFLVFKKKGKPKKKKTTFVHTYIIKI